MTIQIAADRRSLERQGKPLFYLADTVWSAFTNATLEEWEEYLDYRKMQGFNVLQINILRQWDASGSDLELEPFAEHKDGTTNYSVYNERYFDRAEEMVRMATERGFTPALVLLWCNYVPDTWATKFQKNHKMPLEAVKPYVTYAVNRFSKFNPVYLVSGDTDFPSEEANAYYQTALETVKQISPSSLTTLHIQGRLRNIPETFANHEGLDFYMYQSGHNSEFQAYAHEIAEHFTIRHRCVQSSTVNPVTSRLATVVTYMGATPHSTRARLHGRVCLPEAVLVSRTGHTESGAGTKRKIFWHCGREGFDSPYDWRSALRFEGAWDYSFIKYLFDQYKLVGAKPLDIVLNPTKEIRAAGNEDTIVLYVPVNTKVRLDFPVEDYEFTTIDLVQRRFAQTESFRETDYGVIPMHAFEHDVVIIGRRK